jgi:hypothetical protein
MAVPPQEICQADFNLPSIALGTQVHLLMLEHPAQPLNKDVVVIALPARPTDLVSLGLET